MIKTGEKMSELKSLSTNLVLLLLLVTFAFLVNTASAVDIHVDTGRSQIADIMANALSSPALEAVINSTEVEITAERINAKPLLNDPTTQDEMVQLEKEAIRSDEMNIVKSALSSQLPPQQF